MVSYAGVTDRAFLRLGRFVSHVSDERVGLRRTEHLERLPDRLLVENMLTWIRIGAVLYALHVLWSKLMNWGKWYG